MAWLKADRKFLKADRWGKWQKIETDQKKGIPAPPPEKPWSEDAVLIDLVAPEDLTVGQMPLIEAIRRRRSRREYTRQPLSLEELSYLLWATQGVSKVAEGDGTRAVPSRRTVPSGGARHPFETYLLVKRVEGQAPGLYRYLPLEHKIYLLSADAGVAGKVHEATFGQFVEASAVTFIWTAIPYRTEWRKALCRPRSLPRIRVTCARTSTWRASPSGPGPAP